MSGSPPAACFGCVPYSPNGLDVAKELADQRVIEILHGQLGRRSTTAFAGIVQEKPECVAISRDRIRASVDLSAQALGEEALDQGRKRRGAQARASVSKDASARCDANPRSSGTASIYQ